MPLIVDLAVSMGQNPLAVGADCIDIGRYVAPSVALGLTNDTMMYQFDTYENVRVEAGVRYPSAWWRGS